MAEVIFTDGFVEIDSNDMSVQVRSVTLNYSAQTEGNFKMGLDTAIETGTLKEWSLEVEFEQSFDNGGANAVDSILFPLMGTKVVVEVRATSAARSATNPGYNGSAVLTSYPPITGSGGELLKTTATFAPASTLLRSVA